MVKINLLKDSRPSYAKSSSGTKSRFGKKFVVFAAFLILGTSATGSYFAYVRYSKKPQKKKEIKIADPVSSARYLNVVEDIVVDDNQKKLIAKNNGMLSLAFENMTYEEKIIYGFLFVPKLVNTINNCAGLHIDFNSLEVNNFKDLYVLGVASNSTELTTFFDKLKESSGLDSVKLFMSKSQSTGRHKFAIKGGVNFGLDYAMLGSNINLNSIPPISQYEQTLKNFKTLGEKSGIEWVRFEQLALKAEGKYQCHVISIEGKGNYSLIVNFVNLLYKDVLTISFPKFSIIAIDNKTTKLEIEGWIYTKTDQ